jgi:hypothetical protein
VAKAVFCVCAVYLEVTVFISRSVISSIDAAYCHFCSAGHQLFFLLQQLHSSTARAAQRTPTDWDSMNAEKALWSLKEPSALQS